MNLNQQFRQSKPRPLLDSEQKIALFFSAKSGCTFMVKWFFYQIGKLEEALNHSNKIIHHYRMDVFYPSAEYKNSMKDFLENPDKYVKIKAVRNLSLIHI